MNREQRAKFRAFRTEMGTVGSLAVSVRCHKYQYRIDGAIGN